MEKFDPEKYIKKINVARVTSDDMKILDADYGDKKDYQAPLDEVSEELQVNFDKNLEHEKVDYLEARFVGIANREASRNGSKNNKRHNDKTNKFGYSRN